MQFYKYSAPDGARIQSFGIFGSVVNAVAFGVRVLEHRFGAGGGVAWLVGVRCGRKRR